MERLIQTVAVQGELGAYHARAVMQAAQREGGPLYGVKPEGIIYRPKFRQVFDLLDGTDPNGDLADAAAVAINNNNMDDVEADGGGPRKIMWAEHDSLWGDPDAQSRWCIVGEEILQIDHKLLVARGTGRNIHTVITQRAAANQCPGNIDKLRESNPGLHLELVDDTAMSARLVAEWGREGKLGYAAIASAEAGVLNGLEVADKRFQDEEINMTRFLILQRRTNGLIVPEGANTTTFLMETNSEKQAGALYEAIEPFAQEGINMSDIQSRLIRGTTFRSRFWIEAEAGYNEERMQRSLARMREAGCEVHILGSYVRHPYPIEQAA